MLTLSHAQIFNWMCILKQVEKFVGGWWEFSVLLWSKPLTFKLKFCNWTKPNNYVCIDINTGISEIYEKEMQMQVTLNIL